MGNELITGIASVGGALGVVIFAVRWILHMEKDVIRRQTRQIAELEADTEKNRQDVDKWRNAYWQLRAAVWSVNVHTAVENRIELPPPPT